MMDQHDSVRVLRTGDWRIADVEISCHGRRIGSANCALFGDTRFEQVSGSGLRRHRKYYGLMDSSWRNYLMSGSNMSLLLGMHHRQASAEALRCAQ